MKRYPYEQGSHRKEAKNCICQIIFYIEKIESFTKGLTREEFLKDELKVYAVDDLVRNIGEAIRVLAKHRQIRNLFYLYRPVF